jgi:hypothetical protein
MESYAHKAAKSVVNSWLIDADAHALDDIYARCLGTHWLTPSYWMEYPILADGTGIQSLWCNSGFNVPPTFEFLRERGTPPTAILDLAVTEYKSVRTGIEIVHKNPPSALKLEFLRDKLPELLILPAKWVLGQVAPPKQLPGEFWAWR